MGTVAVALTSWRLAWLSELGRRFSFFIQLLFMCINDGIWVVFWLLVFSHRDSIRGWDQQAVLVLFAIVTCTYGVGIGLFYGVRRLGERIHGRDLDPLLVQPGPVVVRILFARIHPPLLGDLAFGPVLFALATAGGAPASMWARYAAVVLLASVVVVAFNVAWESLAFWSEAGSEVAGVAFTAITVLGTYPAAIYSGIVKVIVFTVVPAAFIGTIPAQVVLDPSPALVLALLAAAVVSATVALLIFQAGLRRYMRLA